MQEDILTKSLGPKDFILDVKNAAKFRADNNIRLNSSGCKESKCKRSERVQHRDGNYGTEDTQEFCTNGGNGV